MLAGYFAWKSAQSDDTDIFDADVDASTSQMKKKQSSSFKTVSSFRRFPLFLQ